MTNSQQENLGDFPARTGSAPVNIASGQTTSAAVDLIGIELCGILWPAAMTGATVTFLVSIDETNFYPMVDSTGANVSVTVAAGKYTALNPALYAGLRFLQIVSASAEGAARSFSLVGRAE